MPGVWNIFSIGRHPRNEDQLTEMLAWLIQAVPDIGHSLVGLAFDRGHVDGEIQVVTQHGIAEGRLDALLLGPELALVIESKIDSGFGDDQIGRYLRWLSSAHGHRARRGLLTITAHPAPWSDSDIDLARELEIMRAEHLWEEVHSLFDPLVEEPGREVLAARLISEFLEMLSEEGLIPMKPLAPNEFTQWRDAYRTVRRFHDYFLDCREAIGLELGAEASSKSTNEGYIWQDYVYEDGSKIVVGLGCTDEDRVARSAARRTPILWMAVEAQHWSDWNEAKERLEASPPAGWRPWKRWWGERPQIYRHLQDVLGDASFEDQRRRLAEACSVGTAWLRAAESHSSASDLEANGGH